MPTRIKNWKKFQHFKDRRPPWIKLHREILDQRDINMISDCSFRVLVGIWLLASEDEGMSGEIPSIDDIAFRLRKDKSLIINSLIEIDSFLEHDDIKTISERYQLDEPETETEAEKRQRTEAEREGEGEAIVGKNENHSQKEKSAKKSIPDENQKIAERVIDYLNKETNSAYRSVYTNVNLINARIREGHTEEQLIQVIDEKVADWGNDKKMSKYLRPSTLFNSSKFSQYVGQAGRLSKKKQDIEDWINGKDENVFTING